MERHFKYVLLTISLLISSHATYAQWTFNLTYHITAGCAQGDPEIQREIRQLENEVNAMWQQAFSQGVGFPSKQICEQVRQMILGVGWSDGACRIYYTCTSCTGTDIAMPGQGSNQTNPTTGNLNFNGAVQGEPVFSSNPALDTPNWIDDADLQQQLLNPNTYPKSFTPKTGHPNHDKAYSDLADAYGDKQDNKPIPSKSADYDLFKGIGADAGVNIGDFFSPEDWAGMNLSSDEWDKKFKQFTDAIDNAKRIDREKRMDDFETHLMLTGIDMTAFAANSVIPGGPITGSLIGGIAEAGKQAAVGDQIAWNDVGIAALNGGLGNLSSGKDDPLLDAGISMVTTKLQGGTNIETTAAGIGTFSSVLGTNMSISPVKTVKTVNH